GALSKGALTQAYAANDVGQVAGISGGSAFRRQNGVMTNIGQLGRYPAGPNAINHSGQVVGTASGPSGPATRAWIWTGSGSVTDLNGLIPKKTGWTMQDAYGINDAGQIVGAGQYPP